MGPTPRHPLLGASPLTVRCPDRVSELTPDFFRIVLGLPVVSCEVEPIGAGTGILGSLARVHLFYAGGPEAPASVIVKLPTEFPPNREIGMAFGFYEREGLFFERLAADAGVAVPRCYWSHAAAERDEFGLVLEDLGALVQPNQHDGASFAQIREAVVAIAHMHGRWWASGELESFEWIPRVDDPGERELTNQVYQDSWATFLDRFGDGLTAEAIEHGELVRHCFTDVIDHLGSAPRTLVHGDYHAGNLFFDLETPQRRVVVVDWQIVHQSCGVFDVAYLLGGSTRVEDRRRWERQVVAEYHEALVDAGVCGYSLADCWNDYRWSMMYATVYPIDASSFELDTTEALVMVREWSNRFFTALTDLVCVDLLDR